MGEGPIYKQASTLNDSCLLALPVAFENNESIECLWGMAWEVKNIEKTHKRLSEAGVILTDIKDGRKPNTLVTTVKSHTLNIPTLLIEHLSS